MIEAIKIFEREEFSDNKVYFYLKPTDFSAPKYYRQSKIHKFLYVLFFDVVAPHCLILTNI